MNIEFLSIPGKLHDINGIGYSHLMCVCYTLRFASPIGLECYNFLSKLEILQT